MEMGGSDAHGRPKIPLHKLILKLIHFQPRYLVPERPLFWRINHPVMNGSINSLITIAARVAEGIHFIRPWFPPKAFWAIQLVAWRCGGPSLS